ncbi:MAG: penicillin acylase family protein [Chloroflexota bacterium]
MLDNPQSAWLPNGYARESVLINALEACVRLIREKLGNDPADWCWGAFHQISFSHSFSVSPMIGPIFNQGPFPIGGDTDTVMQTASYPVIDGEINFLSNGYSPAFRQILDMGDFNRGLAMTIPGQSGRLEDVHYGSLIKPWLAGEYYTPLWSRETNLVVSRQQLVP